MEEKDEPKGFYVEPKYDCPHIDDAFAPDPSEMAATGPCTSCADNKENWACLTCNKRFCSRFIKGHMQQHNKDTGHPLCTSYSDLSVWCYSCDSYIADPRFPPLLEQMEIAKFGDSGTRGRYTSHATKEQMEEKQDSPAVLKKKIRQLAQLIKQSNHLIAFTGAGLATSSGIPDFRGPQGVWTLRAQGKRRTDKVVSLLSAVPSFSHMALVKLWQEGLLKYIISQNVDGLHRRSGVPAHHISELHGNTNMEVCGKCCKEYSRDFECMRGVSTYHTTGRKCSVEGCDGELQDTIINFGESLPLHSLQRGWEEADMADVCIALGSSLSVTPAADMPKLVGKKRKGKLVIVNLQKTPLDKLASLRIFGKCDEVMKGVMKELHMDVPPFTLTRTAIISHDASSISISAIDTDGTPLTLFSEVEVTFPLSGRKETLKEEAYNRGGGSTAACKTDGRTLFRFDRKEEDGHSMEVKLSFFGHYGEPSCTLRYTTEQCGPTGARKYLLEYSPNTAAAGDDVDMEEEGRWHVMEGGEATEKDLSQGKGGISAEEMSRYPNSVQDDRHSEHPLKLVSSVYDGVGYRCNGCLDTGKGWVYTCADCQYDLHPACAIWRRGVKND